MFTPLLEGWAAPLEAVPSQSEPKLPGESTEVVDAENVPKALRFTEPGYADEVGGLDVSIVHRDYRQRDAPIMKGDFPSMDAKIPATVFIAGEEPVFVSGFGKSGSAWLRSSFSLHTQYPSANLHIKRGTGGEVTVRFFPTCLSRETGKMGFRFFGGAGGTAPIPQGRDKLSVEIAELLTQKAYFETCMGLRMKPLTGLNGLVWSGIDQGRLDDLETQSKAGHKLSDADMLIVALRRSNNVSIITKRPVDTVKNMKAMKYFTSYFNAIMWLCVSVGCNWFYRLQGLGKELADHDYPFELSTPPRWLVKRFNVSSADTTFTKLTPAEWGTFPPCMDYPDAETFAFIQRLALHREEQHQRRAIEKMFSGGENGQTYATFMSNEAFPDTYLVKLTLGHPEDEHTSRHQDANAYADLVLPEIDTKLELCYSVLNQGSWIFPGQIVDVHSASDIVCAVFAPPGRSDNVVPLDTRVPVTVELKNDPTSTARCVAAIEEISKGHQRPKGVDLPAVILGAPARILSTGSLAEAVTQPMRDAFNKELKERVKLNDEQKAAARNTLNSVTGVSIIRGGPGTGKTSTLMAAVAGHVMAGRQAKNSADRRKVLVCAFSNQAVDACLTKFSKKNGSNIKAVRFRGAFAKSTRLNALVSATESADKDVKMTSADDESAEQLNTEMSGTDDPTVPSVAAQPPAEPASYEPDISLDQMTPNESTESTQRKLTDEEVEEQARIWNVMLDIKTNSNSLDHTELAFNRQRQHDIEQWSSTPGHAMQKDAAKYLSVQEQLRDQKVLQRKQLRAKLFELENVLTEKFCESVDVVFATCNMSCHEVLMNHFKFNVIVIDESGQSTAPDTATPLAAFKESVELVVLGGDHKQMPPVVLSERFNECFRALSVSLFERLIDDPSGRCLVQTLSKQYRMHPHISAWPSKEIYTVKDGAGKTVKGLEDHNSTTTLTDKQHIMQEYLVAHLGDAYSGRMRIAVDISGEDGSYANYHAGSKSKKNDAEASFIVDQVKKLLAFQPTGKKCKPIEPADIAIVTPYTGQRRLITELLNRAARIDGIDALRHIQVATVNQMQGHECNIEIISLVAHSAKDPMDFGFVYRRHMLNVALTRARGFQMIVGAFDTWTASIVDEDIRWKRPKMRYMKSLIESLNKPNDGKPLVTDIMMPSDFDPSNKLKHSGFPTLQSRGKKSKSKQPDATMRDRPIAKPKNAFREVETEIFQEHNQKKRQKQRGKNTAPSKTAFGKPKPPRKDDEGAPSPQGTTV
ncbi:hypothetical protein W97_08588 [Coniosporium apollinis CBS 100218]|uniref:AAA+ ATPase domain-containing protein n=1 Tax=Coniosporium apollinis (strain CBS 100218) TaxID=1168221 RepID=R7Z5E3_CONA1|nr:uncharacterized protein W97_08588 [Coniosporium apollinis CBS 100218]EON69328.1 hypothetical protein W97_08588 [Coniosporium apollinis CBS 100218]